MISRRGASRLGLTAAVLAVIALSTPASAEPAKCQRAVAKAAAKYEQDRTKTLNLCEQGKIKATLPPSTDCASEPTAAGKIAKAAESLRGTIAKACGGKDKVCGVDSDDTEDFPAEIGFPATCHDLDGTGCDGVVADCGDVADCLVCVAGVATDAASGITHGALVPGTGDDKTLSKCQKAISRESAKFLRKKAQTLQKCWDQRLNGKHADVCPDPLAAATSPARKAAETIAKAEELRTKNICKACGGADKACGGLEDIGVAAIGFAASCPDVVAPIRGESCGAIGTVTTLAEIDQCVGCVTDHNVDCADRGAVPSLVAYPDECIPDPPPPSCTSAEVTVVTSYTPLSAPAYIGGVQASVNYPGPKLDIPGSGTAGSVVARVANLTGVSNGLFSAADLNLVADAFDDRLNAGLVTFSDAIPPGSFVRITFDCRAGQPGPTLGEFACTSSVSDGEGAIVPSSCQVTSLTTTP